MKYIFFNQPEIGVKLDNAPSHWQNGDSTLSCFLLVANLQQNLSKFCQLQQFSAKTISKPFHLNPGFSGKLSP